MNKVIKKLENNLRSITWDEEGVTIKMFKRVKGDEYVVAHVTGNTLTEAFTKAEKVFDNEF